MLLDAGRRILSSVACQTLQVRSDLAWQNRAGTGPVYDRFSEGSETADLKSANPS